MYINDEEKAIIITQEGSRPKVHIQSGVKDGIESGWSAVEIMSLQTYIRRAYKQFKLNSRRDALKQKEE